MKDFPPDTFTESDVLSCLQGAGKKFKNGSKYILAQCPTHDDRTPSVQIFKDDWFVSCLAGCGRYHITRAFPELRGYNSGQKRPWSDGTNMERKARKPVIEQKYKTFDLMDEWRGMALIPGHHKFKNIPIETLNDLGWRWDEAKNSYFIPYFSRSKKEIPFAQWRHLSGERRFTMLKDAKPTCYGTWNLKPGEKLFVVEGTSDCAVLEACLVPWIGLPSASSGELLRSMATWCHQNAVQLVYAGDNDNAGEALRAILEEVMPYRVKQPPKKYKDWGDFYATEGGVAVQGYCYDELFPDLGELQEDIFGAVENVFPGAEIIPNAGEVQSKERSTKPAVLF